MMFHEKLILRLEKIDRGFSMDYYPERKAFLLFLDWEKDGRYRYTSVWLPEDLRKVRGEIFIFVRKMLKIKCRDTEKVSANDERVV